MARQVQVTFDAADPHTLAAWWSELLGYEVEDHHEFISGLLADGAVTEEQVARIDGRLAFADATAASDPDDKGPRCFFQRVPEPKTAKNRMHLDVPGTLGDLEAEVEQLVGRGAQFVEFGEHPGQRWAVMRDPEGNEFCLH
jgi:hypothetical protein